MFNGNIFLIVGLSAAMLCGACGSDAKPSAVEGGADTAVIPMPDGPPDDKAPIPDAAAPDSASPIADGPVPSDGGTGDTGVDGATDLGPSDDSGGAGNDSAGSDGGGDDAQSMEGGASDLAPIRGPLLGHWPFDESTGTTAADTTGNDGNGTLIHGPTWTTAGFPTAKFPNAGAVVLDGMDDVVELGTRAIPRHEAPQTVSLWFYQDAPSVAAGRKNLVALTNFGTTDDGTQLGLDAGRVSVWLMGDPAGLVTDTAVATAGWHHLAYSYDGAIVRLYLDARLVGEVTKALVAAPTSHAWVGGFDVPGLEMFGGRIDDVRIYDSALDLTAISLLAGGGAP